MDTLGIVLPVFGLIAAGYLARRTALVGERVGDGLSEFVFTVAVPCLIVRTLARADIPAVQPWGYWVAYFAGAGFAWILGTLAARHLFKVDGTRRARGPGRRRIAASRARWACPCAPVSPACRG